MTYLTQDDISPVTKNEDGNEGIQALTFNMHVWSTMPNLVARKRATKTQDLGKLIADVIPLMTRQEIAMTHVTEAC